MSTLRVNCPHCKAITSIDETTLALPDRCPACEKEMPGTTPSDSRVWYCARTSREMLGPFALDWLKHLVENGQLTRTDRVWQVGLPYWTEASRVSGLFESASEASTELDEALDLEDYFGIEAKPEAAATGPISLQGIHVHQGLTLTWDDFQVIRKVGSGNMGAVYLAKQISQDREVALKVLYPHLAKDLKFVDRFYREADAMQAIEHPAVVSCHGVGIRRNCPYLAMEFVRGHDSARVMKRVGGKYAVGDALYIILRCLEGLAHAHEKQIVHRDFKPENVMLDLLGYVKITDLGLAKPMNEDSNLTDTGVGMGTPKYMAPEQGRDARSANERSDIYSIGGVLYTYLTGRPPFDAETPMGILKAKEEGFYKEAHRVNPEVPSKLGLIVDKMLARDPEHRFASCREVIAAIESLEIANPMLRFDILDVCRGLEIIHPEDIPADRIEILLVHDSKEIVKLATDALTQSKTASNLNVVKTGDEALDYLGKKGPHANAPRPNLIVVGFRESQEDVWALLEEFKNNTWLHGIPMAILAPRDGGTDEVKSRGFPVKLTITDSEQLPELGKLIDSVHEMCLTVVEWPPRP